jgi:PHD/YefM family antitoxin component YafN of YafNO toxin-antitoxin module
MLLALLGHSHHLRYSGLLQLQLYLNNLSSFQGPLYKDGKRTAVLLDIEQYNNLMEELEELESIRAYDAAKSSGEEAIPFEQAIKEIEKQR